MRNFESNQGIETANISGCATEMNENILKNQFQPQINDLAGRAFLNTFISLTNPINWSVDEIAKQGKQVTSTLPDVIDGEIALETGYYPISRGTVSFFRVFSYPPQSKSIGEDLFMLSRNENMNIRTSYKKGENKHYNFWLEQLVKNINDDIINFKKEQSSILNYLSDQERNITRLLVQGCTNRDISKILVISEFTTKTHIGNILHKLGYENRTQLAINFWDKFEI